MGNRIKKNFYELSSGNKFRQYHIDSVLGKGAMGVVYKAFDERLQRYVALKVIQASFIGEKEHKQFVREVKAIANLNHDNIVKLFEVGTDPTYYFTMEYVKGETLAQVLKNENISYAAIARIVSKIALGLYHAHLRGIVHGDIKPENIMITHDREPKIMDFGLAKDHNSSQLSQDGVQGTPAYLAPEQLQNAKIDKRADIYALGVTLYRCLAGKLPFNEKNYVSLFYQIINETPRKLRSENSSIPSELELICEKCMQKSPQNRYTNARFLARDLQNFLVGRPLWVQSSSSVMDFIKHTTVFRWIEILCGISCIYLMIVAIDRWSEPAIERKIFTEEDQKRFSDHQKKSQKISPWYRDKNYTIHHLQLLSKRKGFGDKLWKKDVEDAIHDIHKKLQQRSVFDLEQICKFLQVIVEIQIDTYIDDRFNKLCILANKFAKKLKLYRLSREFEQLEELHDFVNSKKDRRKKNLIGKIFKETTNPYIFFYLSHKYHYWMREKLLLHAIYYEKNHGFYGKLGIFYINNHFYDEGIALCEQQLRQNPYAPLAHYYIARGLIFSERYENALEHLNFLDKNYFGQNRELIFLEKARIFFMKKDYKKAKKFIEDAKNLVLQYENEPPNFAKTYKVWQRLIANNTGQNVALELSETETIKWYYDVGEIDKAYSLIDKLQGDELPLKFAIYRKVLNKNLRNFRPNEKIWKKACNEIASNLRKEQKQKKLVFSSILYRYAFEFLTGRLSVDKEYIDEQLKLLYSVSQQLGEYYFVDFYKACFFKGKGLYQHAVVLCNRAKKLALWYKDEIELIEKISLARWYQYTRKKTDVAIEIAEEMVGDYNYGPAHTLLGYIHTSSNTHKALYHFNQVQTSSLSISDFFDFHFDRASLYAKQHMYDEAIQFMEKYLKVNPTFKYAQKALENFREKQN